MGNASKALLMAGGILLGVLILALMVTLFASSKSLSDSYEETKKSEAVQQFNANFIKYLGQDLTIHQVLTIYNFAKENGFEEDDIIGPFDFENAQISEDLKEAKEKLVELASGDYYHVEKIYKLSIETYDSETGCVSKIKITEPTQNFKCYKRTATGEISIDYKS